MRKLTLATIALIGLGGPAWAADISEEVIKKQCMFQGASMVPKVPGLVVKSVSVTPESTGPIYEVRIVVEAVGMQSEFMSLCKRMPGTRVTQADTAWLVK